MKCTHLILLFFCVATYLSAQTVSNMQAKFTECHVEVEYDLATSKPVDLVLKYTGDGGKTWIPCSTVSGDLTGQNTGTKKLIIWDNQADNIVWGKFTFRVEAPKLGGCTVKSSLPVGELTFMCYNLGAKNMSIEEQMAYTPANDEDATVYGDLYQWGRSADGHEKRYSSATYTLSTSDRPGHGNFIVSFAPNWLSYDDNNLWSATKTQNDPCPEGWRMPTHEEWASIIDVNKWEWNSTGTPGYKISPDGGGTFTLFLPAAGARSSSIQYGPIYGLSSGYGNYWSSTWDNRSSFSLYFGKNIEPPLGISTPILSVGLSCRCVAE